MKLDKIVTRGGDRGETSLADGSRLSKAATRMDCIGELDELGACLGLVRLALSSSATSEKISAILAQVQSRLFDLGAHMARVEPDPQCSVFWQREVELLEEQLETWNADLPQLESFVLAGSGESSTHLHLCRAVCRRCERSFVKLATAESIVPQSLVWLNRLSDWLFVLSRKVCIAEGQRESLWFPREKR